MVLEDLSDIYSFGNIPSPSLNTPSTLSSCFQDFDSIMENQLQHLHSITEQELKIHQLPLARIKKIMKSDEDVKMISADAPLAFSKSCEFFILELTHRAWLHAESENRRTVHKSDITYCIANTIIFDFLIDVIL